MWDPNPAHGKKRGREKHKKNKKKAHVMERVATEGEAIEECFGSIGFEVKLASSQLATEGPTTKKKKKGEGPKGLFRYQQAEKFFYDLQASHT